MKAPIVLCDHPCPICESCGLYCPGLDRTRTLHMGTMPYREGKCNFYEEIDIDEAIEGLKGKEETQ